MSIQATACAVEAYDLGLTPGGLCFTLNCFADCGLGFRACISGFGFELRGLAFVIKILRFVIKGLRF